MINMDQVRTLEMKVKQTVQLIVQLRKENDSLRSRLSDAEVRLLELDSVLDGYKATQNEMESGIRSALRELDHVGDVGPAETSASSEPEAGFVAEAASTTATVPEPEPLEEPSVMDEATAVSEPEFAPEASMEQPEIQAEEFPMAVDKFVSEDEQEWATAPEEPIPEEEAEPQQPGLGIF